MSLTVVKTVSLVSNPAGQYMFKIKNKNTRTRCEICSKLTVKTITTSLTLF